MLPAQFRPCVQDLPPGQESRYGDMALGFDGSVDGLRVFTDLSQPKEEMHTGVGVAAVVRVGWYMVRTGWDSLSFLGGLLGQLRQLLIAIRVRGIQQVGRQFWRGAAPEAVCDCARSAGGRQPISCTSCLPASESMVRGSAPQPLPPGWRIGGGHE